MPTPRTHACSVSTCDILSLTLIIHDDEYKQTNTNNIMISIRIDAHAAMIDRDMLILAC